MTIKIYVGDREISSALEHRGQIVLTYRLHYPQFATTVNLPYLRTVNAFYAEQAARRARTINTRHFKAAADDFNQRAENGDPFEPYDFLQVYKPTHLENSIVSLYTDYYEYTGGAHGTTLRTAETWDARRGEHLNFCMFFRDCDAAIARAMDMVVIEIGRESERQDGIYFDNPAELVKNTFNPDNFFLTADDFAVFFQQYDIAPYATGIPVFYLPYSDIGAEIPRV